MAVTRPQTFTYTKLVPRGLFPKSASPCSRSVRATTNTDICTPLEAFYMMDSTFQPDGYVQSVR